MARGEVGWPMRATATCSQEYLAPVDGLPDAAQCMAAV